jgi:hypothetical protein
VIDDWMIRTVLLLGGLTCVLLLWVVLAVARELDRAEAALRVRR